MGKRKQDLAFNKITDLLQQHKISFHDGATVMLIMSAAALVDMDESKEEWVNFFSDVWDSGEDRKKELASTRSHSLKVVK